MGKSGSFFFFSWDGKIILKTLKEDELKILRSYISAEYVNHSHQNPQSLMAKIYGYFTVEIKNMQPIHLILMENTLDKHKFGIPDRLYDLKGSLVNRVVKVN